MTGTDLDNIRHGLRMAAFHYRTDAERHWMQCAADSIVWYIDTGRAPSKWLSALKKADAVKLLRRMANADDLSTDGQLRIVTSYLIRYCGYKG